MVELYKTTAVEECGVTICMTRTIGIAQDSTVIVCHMIQKGVMVDSEANACMVESETHLVGCHAI